jgi:hypothetical protein
MADKAANGHLDSLSSAGKKSGGASTPRLGSHKSRIAKAGKSESGASNKSIGKAVGVSVASGLNAKKTVDDIRRTKEQDGAGAAAAATAVKGAEAIASKTGVGTLVTGAIRGAQAGLAKVGINVKDQYILYALLLVPILALTPVIIFALVVFFAWKNPAAILKLSFTNFKTFVGALRRS